MLVTYAKKCNGGGLYVCVGECVSIVDNCCSALCWKSKCKSKVRPLSANSNNSSSSTGTSAFSLSRCLPLTDSVVRSHSAVRLPTFVRLCFVCGRSLSFLFSLWFLFVSRCRSATTVGYTVGVCACGCEYVCVLVRRLRQRWRRRTSGANVNKNESHDLLIGVHSRCLLS